MALYIYKSTKSRLTKRKPDLRDWRSLSLSYVVVEGVSPAQVFRFLANRLRKR